MFKTYSFLNLVNRAALIIGMLTIAWIIGLISLLILQICLLISLVIFVLIPVIFRYSVQLQRCVLFLTFITYPKGLDLKKPERIGLFATRNFYIDVHDPEVYEETGLISIGVWHILPLALVNRFAPELDINLLDHEEEFFNLSQHTDEYELEHDKLEPIIRAEYPDVDETNEQQFYQRLLNIPGNVVLYLHGNTATRGSGHRIDVYKLLRKLGYHVITMDYRGYADSDDVPPTEEGVVRDALTVYQYICNITTNPIFIWGHSLGTGVTTHLCAQLSNMRIRAPAGVILESPFTNIREEIRQHPFSKPFKDLPWFEMTISQPMYKNSLRFESDVHISKFRQPIMILHSEDDHVVPFQLGYKLYRIALETRDKGFGPVEFHRFAAANHYGHKFIYRDPELPKIMKNFVKTYRKAVF